MKAIVVVILCLFCHISFAQVDSAQRNTADTGSTVQRADSVLADTLQKPVAEKPITWSEDTVFFNSFNGPLMPDPKKKAIMQIAAERPIQSKDDLFYWILGVFAFFGIIRFFFPKYVQNLFSLLFQSSFRQKQTRDQLIQDTLPSILVNLLFFITAGLFLTVTAEKMNLNLFSFEKTFLYITAGLAIIYVTKYLFLLFFGWVFNVSASASVYSFIVFLINKILGVLLLPLLLLIAFSGMTVVNVVITIAGCIFILLLVYRYIAALSGIRADLHINVLHFFIYLCAVEIVPLLVIFKLLNDRIGSGI